MYKDVSSLFEQTIMANSRTFRAKMESGGNVADTGFFDLLYTGKSSQGDYISIGGAVSSTVTVKMRKPNFPIAEREFLFSVGLAYEDEEGFYNEKEYVPLGYFTTDKPVDDDGVVSFTAYDRIATKFNFDYVTDIKNYPVDAKVILQELSSKSGVDIDISALPNGVMIDRLISSIEYTMDDDGNEIENVTYIDPFEGYVAVDALSKISELYGMFAICDRSGKVVFKWYEKPSTNLVARVEGNTLIINNATINGTEADFSELITSYANGTLTISGNSDFEYTVEANRYFDDLIKDETQVVITSISNTINDYTQISGEGVINVNSTNEHMTDSNLDSIFNKIKGFSYTPASVSFMGDPRLDIGDIVVVHDKYGNTIEIPIMEMTIDYDGGLITAIKSLPSLQIQDADKIFQTVKSPTEKALDKLQKDVGNVKEEVSDKASFDDVQNTFIGLINANSRISLLEDEISIIAPDIDVTGFVKFSDLANAGQTTINGANLITGSIDADKLNVDDLFAKEINITGGIVSYSDDLKDRLDISKGTIAQFHETPTGFRNSILNYGELEITHNSSSYTKDVLLDEDKIKFSTTHTNGATETVELATKTEFDEETALILRTVDKEGRMTYSMLTSYKLFLPEIEVLESVLLPDNKQVIGTSRDRFNVSYINGHASGSKKILYINSLWEDVNYSTVTLELTSSDARLKENISNTKEIALDTINNLKLREFDWVEDGSHEKLGFIADEIEQVNESFAVGGGYDENGNMIIKTVSVLPLVAYLTKGEQELCQQLDFANNRILSLEQRVGELEIMINNLMNRGN